MTLTDGSGTGSGGEGAWLGAGLGAGSGDWLGTGVPLGWPVSASALRRRGFGLAVAAARAALDGAGGRGSRWWLCVWANAGAGCAGVATPGVSTVAAASAAVTAPAATRWARVRHTHRHAPTSTPHAAPSRTMCMPWRSRPRAGGREALAARARVSIAS